MTIKETTVTNIGDRATYLVIDWSLLGTWKRVNVDLTNGKAPSEVRSMKRLMKSESVSSMSKLKYRVKKLLGTYSLNSLFRQGVYVVPLEYVQHVDYELQAALAELENIKETLKDEWQDVIEEAKERLGDYFDSSDYCSAESASKQFALIYRYMPIDSTPDILKHVAADVYKADLERSKKEIEKELQAFQDNLRLTLLGIIDNMRATLTKPDGDKRVFGKRFFKRLDEFLETFNMKNLSDDGALANVVAQLREVSNGTDVMALKSSIDVQVALDTSLLRIGNAMATMLQDEGRAIDLS